MTRQQAADRLGYHPSTVSRLAAEGRLQRVGRHYTRTSVEQLAGTNGHD
ncbi:MAG: type IV toxin-antitoxin system AbiEi family antitoxin domain-containing protein [Actinomycetota bacterium]